MARGAAPPAAGSPRVPQSAGPFRIFRRPLPFSAPDEKNESKAAVFLMIPSLKAENRTGIIWNAQAGKTLRNRIMTKYESLTRIGLGFMLGLFCACSSVTFTPVEGEMERASKSGDFEVRVLGSGEADGYRIIGTVSCQDSASSNIWNWWTDYHALIEEMKRDNERRLLKKVRGVGGDVLIGLTHDILSGGSSGGGVGVGVGYGTGNVGVGVGTSILGSNPKVTVSSHGKVGVIEEGGGTLPSP